MIIKPKFKAKVERVIVKNDDIQRKKNRSIKESSKEIKDIKKQLKSLNTFHATHETFSASLATTEYLLHFS